LGNADGLRACFARGGFDVDQFCHGVRFLVVVVTERGERREWSVKVL
jgi:hypothetical protein